MPELLRIGELAGALVAIGAALTLAFRTYRAARRIATRFLLVLEQIRDASGGVQRLARDVEILAGSIGRFVVAMLDNVRDNTARLDNVESGLGELAELVVDLEADVRRELRNRAGQEGTEPT